jgi:hypothetical protein
VKTLNRAKSVPIREEKCQAKKEMGRTKISDELISQSAARSTKTTPANKARPKNARKNLDRFSRKWVIFQSMGGKSPVSV